MGQFLLILIFSFFNIQILIFKGFWGFGEQRLTERRHKKKNNFFFIIQRTLWGGWFADVAFAANKGTHLPAYNLEVGQLADSFLAQAQRSSRSQRQPGGADNCSVGSQSVCLNFGSPAMSSATTTSANC